MPTKTLRGTTPVTPASSLREMIVPGAVAVNGQDTLVRQRILSTADPLSSSSLNTSLTASRIASISNLYLGMSQVTNSLAQVASMLATPSTPAQIIGVLLQPDRTPAATVQIQFNPATVGSAKPAVIVQTDATGSFTLPLPQGLPIPSAGLSMVVHGGNGNATITIPAAQIGANGLVGSVLLPQKIDPLPVSILQALLNITAPTAAPGDNTATITNPGQIPVVKVGEDGGCMLQFGANNSVDRFPYGVFFRLVEPRTSIVTQAQPTPAGTGGRLLTFLPEYLTMSANGAATPADPTTGGTVSYVDRVPVEQPISADGFRDRIMGLKSDGTFTGDETVPMAGTLGLGYVLWLAQRWTFQGVGLGDLVYSLPLAPGEQQQVAIFERTDTSMVTESEFFSEEQAQQQLALADTSTNATFNSAFNESVKGTSSFNTQSDSSSWGTAIPLIASGGSGSSSSSGSSTQTLQGQRNTTQQAAENMHSSAQNQATARRTAMRTGMRLATASETQSVTTKIITNHNHTRALTLQFWEVLRMYDVATAIEGLTLVCLVPMQVVRFLPPGEPFVLTDTSTVSNRNSVIERYGVLAKHADVLMQALPSRYHYGLTLLSQFASDPTAEVEPFGGAAEDVVNFSLQGTFVKCEDVYISAVTRRNTRIGPVKLTNASAAIPDDPAFTSKEELMAWLLSQRQGAVTTMTGALALPQSMNRSDVIGFELSRGFRTLSYTLLSPEMAALGSLNAIFGGSSFWVNQAIESTLGQGSSATARTTITLTPSDLETLGGPILSNFYAAIQEYDSSGNAVPSSPGEQYANESLYGLELPTQPYPVPARQVGAILRFNEILEIEKMAQHVVRNTVLYSRAVWGSLSADERAILLEAYTIGVPPGGVTDASQMIPLLNCVENRVLGYYGNSMIMPFNIPDGLLQQMTVPTNGSTNAAAGTPAAQSVSTVTDIGQIEDALLAYQVAGFKPPHSIVALPTRGVLGEAVLGHCPSAEKIDLTRFWNWQDSPSDTSAQISPVTLPTGSPSLTAGLTAPNSLTNLPSLINNVLTAPPADTSLLQALGKDAASQQDFSSSLTGASQLAGLLTNAQNTANSARSDALKSATDLQSQAMATAGNILGGIYAGNPTAGSSAAAAVHGTSGSGGSGGGGGSGQGAGGKTGTPGSGGGGQSAGGQGGGAQGAGGQSGGGAGPGSAGGSGPGGSGGAGGPGSGGAGASGSGGGAGAGGSGGAGGPSAAPGPPASRIP
ncbi:MAG TPA: hypothetical protein VGZ02_13740 [Candidatus Baltobacteraceae bacterium]|jgi:hypothetical protein|nr:hypothetical protein [Candidatus Baltobacteraceae bacterium]